LAEWEHHKAWLAPTDILLTNHSVEELKKKIQLNILWIKINNAKDIALLELVTGCGRHKNDFPERIWEYSNITALYYLWSKINKETQPEDAYKALFGAVRVLMKLIGVLEALKIAHIQEKQEKKKMTARIKGGKAQNERYDNVKQEIVRQLKSKTVGKYATKQAAAEAIWTIVCQTRSIALSNPGRGAVVVALRWSTEIVNNLCHQKPKKEHRRKRPFGRFLLIQLVNHQPHTQPTHPS